MIKALLLLALVAAPAQTPIPRAGPTARWLVDSSNDRCIASRPFKAAGTDLILGVQVVPTQDSARIYIQAPRQLKTLNGEDARIYVGTDQLPQRRVFVEPVVRPGYARYVIWMTKENYDKFVRTGVLTFDTEHVRASFQVGGLNALQDVFRECREGLLESWGFSKELQARLASFATVAKPLEVASYFDFPDRAMDRRASGQVEALIRINTDGRVESCRLIQSSGHADLDEKTCLGLQRRGRFIPAMDRGGKPMASPYVFSMRWHVGGF